MGPDNYLTGFSATLDIRESLEKEFPFFSVRENSGSLEKTHKRKSVKLREFDTDPEGKVFHQFGVYIYMSCAMCFASFLSTHLCSGYFFVVCLFLFYYRVSGLGIAILPSIHISYTQYQITMICHNKVRVIMR